jgi:hypothetical protein
VNVNVGVKSPRAMCWPYSTKANTN